MMVTLLRVERASACRPVLPLAMKRHANALVHLAGRLVRESQREDGARRDAALEEAHDALRDDTRLSRAGSCKDQKRAGLVLDGTGLRGVQRELHAATGRSTRTPNG